MRFEKIKFIINPNAGFRRDKSFVENLIRRRCADLDFAIVHTTGPGDATQLAQQATQEGCTTVVAVGGDGTVNETASGLVGTETALGVIPRGSGDGLARSLNIPLQATKALEVIRNGKAYHIDAGRAAHRYFFVVAGVGFDASISHQFKAATWRGPVPYFYLAAREFANYQTEALRLCLEDNVMEITPFFVTIANTQQYGNGAVIAPHARPDDGILEVCVVQPMNFAEFVMSVPKLFNGKADTIPSLTYYRTRHAAIEKPGTILFHVDGEAEIFQDKIEISVLPQALKVIVPSSYASSS
jgi:YegS/Rv2252/BmrU family lipid kinase